MGTRDGGLFGMGGDDALLLVFLVGLLGCELLGGLDGVFDGVFSGSIVHFHAHIVVPSALLALNKGAFNLEADFLVVFLAPVYEFAFEIPFCVGHGVDVEVDVDDLVDNHVAGEVVAFFEVDCTDEGLEGVTVDGFEDALRFAVVLDELGEAYLLSQLVEVGTADEFGAHLGQIAFALAGVFLIEEFGHDGAEHGVAKVFETLVVDATSFAHVQRFRLVDKGDLV